MRRILKFDSKLYINEYHIYVLLDFYGNKSIAKKVLGPEKKEGWVWSYLGNPSKINIIDDLMSTFSEDLKCLIELRTGELPEFNIFEFANIYEMMSEWDYLCWKPQSSFFKKEIYL